MKSQTCAHLKLLREFCVRDKAGEPVAALSVSAPSVRYTADRSREFLRELRVTVARAQADITL